MATVLRRRCMQGFMAAPVVAGVLLSRACVAPSPDAGQDFRPSEHRDETVRPSSADFANG